MAEIRAEPIKSHSTKQGPLPHSEQRETDPAPKWAAASLFTVAPQTVAHERINECSPQWGEGDTTTAPGDRLLLSWTL